MGTKKINKSLGKLEEEIMNIIWSFGSASVRDVLNKLRKKRKIAYTTVMTVMARLADKGVLKRKLNENDAYIYRATQDRETFSASVSKNIINHLIKEFGEEVAVAQFLDILKQRDVKKSKQWSERLKKIIK